MSVEAGARAPVVSCPHCGVQRDPRTIVSGPQSCPVCARRFEAVRFDPAPADVSVPRIAEAGPAGGHACPQHAANLSVGNCGRCGVFLCALCRVEAEGRVLCPACFERLDDAGELPGLVSGYRDYGRVQSSLVVLGLLAPCIAVVTGPAALYYGSRALRQQRARGEGRARASVYVASFLAVVEMALCGFVYYMVAKA